MSSSNIQPDHDPKRLYREQQDFLASQQNTSGQAGAMQTPMSTGGSTVGPNYGTQDSKHLYQQQQDFLSSPQNMTGRPGTSQVPIDEATAADGPSYTTQEAPPQYISPASTNLSYIAAAQPNPVSTYQSNPSTYQSDPSTTYQSNPSTTSFSQHNPSATSPIQSNASHILPLRTPSWSKFIIPTKTVSLSSGFPYDERLEPLRVSNEDWFQFSSSIVKASKLTAMEDFAAWTTGITTGTLSSPFLLIFAPMVGIWAGKKVHRKTLQSNVEEKLTGDGDLRTILRDWNENHFSKKGFQAWLEVPSATGKNSTRRFSILIVPNDGMSPAAQPTFVAPHIPALVEADAQQDIRELGDTQVEPPPESRSIRRRPIQTSTLSPVSRTNSPALPVSHTGYTDTKSGEIRHELP